MLIDSLEVLKTETLPQVSPTDTAIVAFLSVEYNGNPPGFYVNDGVEWKPFGAGESVTTTTVNTVSQQTINLADYQPEGLLLSALVTKNVAEDRSIELKRTETGVSLETVTLSDTYTAISIPQPHKLYSLLADPDLSITI